MRGLQGGSDLRNSADKERTPRQNRIDTIKIAFDRCCALSFTLSTLSPFEHVLGSDHIKSSSQSSDLFWLLDASIFSSAKMSS